MVAKASLWDRTKKRMLKGKRRKVRTGKNRKLSTKFSLERKRRPGWTGQKTNRVSYVTMDGKGGKNSALKGYPKRGTLNACSGNEGKSPGRRKPTGNNNGSSVRWLRTEGACPKDAQN